MTHHANTKPMSFAPSEVQSQFGPIANAYVTSSTHARGADLQRLLTLSEIQGDENLLDVATGGGHTALAFASHVRMVTAIDITEEMLHAASQHIESCGITNVFYCRAPAETLPFQDGCFDLVTCRVAAHHFSDVRSFTAEAARVLRPGGALLISDHIGLQDASLDAFMDQFERWRDPTHVRAYGFDEWHTFMDAVGLQIDHTEDFPWEPYDFVTWTERAQMPTSERIALEHWLLSAPVRFREFFQIVEQHDRLISLQSTFGIIVARKPQD